ncbi:hypothetical protein [Pelagibaculum spongiae]|nr:hypothetical protein [Pelagibaculum spongiae]
MAIRIILLEAIPEPGSLSIAGMLLKKFPTATVEQFAWANLSDLQPSDHLYLVREPLLRHYITEIYSPTLNENIILTEENLLILLILRGLPLTSINIHLIGPLSHRKAKLFNDQFSTPAFLGTTISYSPGGFIPHDEGMQIPDRALLDGIITTGREPSTRAIYHRIKLIFDTNFKHHDQSLNNLPSIVSNNLIIAIDKLAPKDLCDLCKATYRLTYPFWLTLFGVGYDSFIHPPICYQLLSPQIEAELP